MTLIERLQRAWCAQTAMSADTWTPDCPEKDQCAVTACIVYEELGLDVVRGQAFLPDGQVDSHYWNDGLDLTKGQYPDGTRIVIRDGVQGRAAYDYLLTNPDLAARLTLLRARMNQI